MTEGRCAKCKLSTPTLAVIPGSWIGREMLGTTRVCLDCKSSLLRKRAIERAKARRGK